MLDVVDGWRWKRNRHRQTKPVQIKKNRQSWSRQEVPVARQANNPPQTQRLREQKVKKARQVGSLTDGCWLWHRPFIH